MEALHSPGAAPARAEPRPVLAPPATEAEAAARRADLQADITRRWSNDDLARSARAMDGAAGRAVYADALQTVDWFYVDPMPYGQLVAAGVESLRAALENPEFRRRFPEADDADRRGRFAEGLDILDLKVRAAGPTTAFQAADWLAAAMEKNRAILGLPDGAVVAEFLFGAFDSLDPYSRFLTPEMDRTYREQAEGTYTGIGAEVTSHDGRFFIKAVFEGGGAAAAGLGPGDEIVAIDGQTVAGLAHPELSRRLRGKAGTRVTLAIRKAAAGAAEDVVRRAPPHPRAGGPRRPDHRCRAPHRVRAAGGVPGRGRGPDCGGPSEDLEPQGAVALILDLRDNPGGELFEAIDVVGLFLSDGPIIRTRGRMIGATINYDVPWPSSRAWPWIMTVLVNGDSASASEVVASALQARGRATVVGQRTFGKGAVQIVFPVGWGAAAVSLTTARVYDIHGECLDGRGVVPDVEAAPAAAPPATLAADPVVRAAIQALAAP